MFLALSEVHGLWSVVPFHGFEVAEQFGDFPHNFGGGVDAVPSGFEPDVVAEEGALLHLVVGAVEDVGAEAEFQDGAVQGGVGEVRFLGLRVGQAGSFFPVACPGRVSVGWFGGLAHLPRASPPL